MTYLIFDELQKLVHILSYQVMASKYVLFPLHHFPAFNHIAFTSFTKMYNKGNKNPPIPGPRKFTNFVSRKIRKT